MAFVVMRAPGQRGHALTRHCADGEPSFVSDDARRGPMREVGVRKRHRAGERVREVAEARAEDDRHVGRARALTDEPSGFLDLIEVIHRTPDLKVGPTHNKNPAIVAVTKFASVPASIARRPRRARS